VNTASDILAIVYTALKEPTAGMGKSVSLIPLVSGNRNMGDIPGEDQINPFS
jgi:hypothetical protein